MSKPVDQLDFWKKRIEQAEDIHHSVFLVDTVEWQKISAAHKEIIQKLVSGRVLDAGCGYGRASDWFWYTENSYLGVDFSPDFIQKAKEIYPERSFEVQDLTALPYPDQSFDWSFCISIKKMVQANLGEERWGLMEKELKRVSKNLLVLEYGDSTSSDVL